MKFGNCLLFKIKKNNICFENFLYKYFNNEFMFFCVYFKFINIYEFFNIKNICKVCFENEKKERLLFILFYF